MYLALTIVVGNVEVTTAPYDVLVVNQPPGTVFVGQAFSVVIRASVASGAGLPNAAVGVSIRYSASSRSARFLASSSPVLSEGSTSLLTDRRRPK